MPSSYSAMLHAFQDAIFSGSAEAADALCMPKEGFSPQAQLRVYYEGYRLRLLDALKEDCKGLLHYLGDEAFRTLALSFIEANPSHHFNLDRYTAPFDAWVQANHPDPFAHELARLEISIARVFLLPDSEALEASWLSTLPPEALATTCFHARTAMEIHRFTHNTDDYVTAAREERTPEPPVRTPTSLIIRRHNNTVTRLAFAPDELTLFEALTAGHTLESLCETPGLLPETTLEALGSNLQGWFTRWLEEGLFRKE